VLLYQRPQHLRAALFQHTVKLAVDHRE